MKFEAWKEELNTIFVGEFGMDSDSFEDYLWRDAWEDGLSPEEAFEDWREYVYRSEV
jgi:hypothetical protein